MGWEDTIRPVKKTGSWEDTIQPASRQMRPNLFDTIDSYTGAPGRKAVSEAAKAPGLLPKLRAGTEGFASQFGAPTSNAPSPDELQHQLGIPEAPLSKVLPLLMPGAGYAAGKLYENTPLDLDTTEFALSAGTDPVSYIPVGKVASLLGTVGTKLTAKAIPKAVPGLLRAGAENAAVRHLRPTSAVSRRLGEEGVNQAAREALDSGSIQFGSKVSNTARRLGDTKEGIGALLGDIRDSTPDPSGLIKGAEADLGRAPGFNEAKGSFDALSDAEKMAQQSTDLANGGGVAQHLTDIGLGTGLIAQAINHPEQLGPILATAIGRGISKGRMASSIAVTLDKLSKLKGEDLIRALESKEVKGLIKAAIAGKMHSERKSHE